MSNEIWIVLAVVVFSIFLIIATKKRWISWKGSHGITSLTAFHDFQPKDKQDAIVIVMEQKAGKKLEEQESGQDADTQNKEE